MLLHSLPAGKHFEPAQILLPAVRIHFRKVTAGVGGEHSGAHIRALQKLFHIELGEEPQRTEELFQA